MRDLKINDAWDVSNEMVYPNWQWMGPWYSSSISPPGWFTIYKGYYIAIIMIYNCQPHSAVLGMFLYKDDECIPIWLPEDVHNNMRIEKAKKAFNDKIFQNGMIKIEEIIQERDNNKMESLL